MQRLSQLLSFFSGFRCDFYITHTCYLQQVSLSEPHMLETKFIYPQILCEIISVLAYSLIVCLVPMHTKEIRHFWEKYLKKIRGANTFGLDCIATIGSLVRN